MGDLLTGQPTRPQAEAQRATGTCGKPESAIKGAHESAHSQKAQEGSGWHSGASVRAAEMPASSAAEKQKTPAKPGKSGASRGSSVERLRSESNRRWRICNPEAEPVSLGNGSDSEEVPTKVPTLAAADPALARVVEAWSDLPPAVRAGILAMVEASR